MNLIFQFLLLWNFYSLQIFIFARLSPNLLWLRHAQIVHPTDNRTRPCTTTEAVHEAPHGVRIPRHLQQSAKRQRRQIIFFYSFLCVIHSCVIDYFSCQTYLSVSFISLELQQKRDVYMCESLSLLQLLLGAEVDANGRRFVMRHMTNDPTERAHSHHTQRRRCRR